VKVGPAVRFWPQTAASLLSSKAVVVSVSVNQKLAARGFEIPPREQQTPEALGAYQQAKIEKWWPIIKAE
jgi:hypothetical protein